MKHLLSGVRSCGNPKTKTLHIVMDWHPGGCGGWAIDPIYHWRCLCQLLPSEPFQAIHREVIFWSVVRRLGALVGFEKKVLLNQVEMIQAIASQRKIGSSCVFVDVLFIFHLYVF